MKITIRPDPDCIELINSEFKDMIIVFLKSIGVPAKDAESCEATHTVEINKNAPPLVEVFRMKCFLPYELFAKTEWVFKFAKEEFFISFIISGETVSCKLLKTLGLKYLPKNIINLYSDNHIFETLNEKFQELKNFPGLKSISFESSYKLLNISLLENLINLQRLDLHNCKSLTDITSLSGLLNLQSLSLNWCESLTDISSLSGLVNLQTLDLHNCLSLTDISGLSGLVNLQTLDLHNCKSLTDIITLTGLPNLQTLDLHNCEFLRRISGLSGLTNLQTLDLHNCKSLTDINSLSGLLNLQSLSLNWLETLADTSTLSSLLNLRSLKLSDCESLTDINILSGLINLQSLKLSSCESLTDIKSLSGLVNLQTLDLSSCRALTDISSLAGLLNLKQLNFYRCELLTDISSLGGLVNLRSLDICNCKSLTDISGLSRLLNLQTLDFFECNALKDISSLAGLLNLRSLKLSACKSLTDVSSLSGLVNLKVLDLSSFRSLTDTSNLAGLLNLQKLNLSYCRTLTDIGSLAGLVKLQSLDLHYCESLTDINSLSGLVNLQSLNLHNCESLADISSLASLLNLRSLNLEECKRIQKYPSLRNLLALKDFNDSKMHLAESAELVCFLAVQRKDISFISQKAASWLKELKLGLDQKHSSTNDLACSLAQGFVLAKLGKAETFHQVLHEHADMGLAPWKIWFNENLKTFGWDKIQKLAELNKPNELTFGAIGGILSCLPSLEGDPAQMAWAKKWISEIHSLHNNNPNFLKPAAAEWCLALKRLGEDELLRDWIEKFTDLSDPSALDPINKVFSAYALELNDSESALEYALKINDPKFRDESILNLAQQFIKEGETTKAGEFLFLLTQVESRTQLAYSLAEDAAYLKNDENAHRLLAACGDNPQSLASILDKLRLANPASEILKIMHEKLSDESRSEIPASLIMQTSNDYTNTLLKIKDSSQLVKIRQAIDSVMKSS